MLNPLKCIKYKLIVVQRVKDEAMMCADRRGETNIFCASFINLCPLNFWQFLNHRHLIADLSLLSTNNTLTFTLIYISKIFICLQIYWLKHLDIHSILFTYRWNDFWMKGILRSTTCSTWVRRRTKKSALMDESLTSTGTTITHLPSHTCPS